LARYLSLFALPAVVLLSLVSTQAMEAASPPPIVPPPGIHMRKIGDPVAVPEVMAAWVGKTHIYLVYNGMPPWLVAANPDGSVVASAPIPEGYNAWAVAEAPDGTVYTATTSNISLHDGYLWAWKPGGKVRLVATLPDTTTVWALSVDPATGTVWVGAHQALYAYQPQTGQVTDYGMPVPGEVDVHTLLAAGGKVYAGLTPHAEVVLFDPASKTATLEATNANTSGVKAISLAPDGSLVVTWGSGALLTYSPPPVATGYLNAALAAPVWWNGQQYTFQGDGTLAVGVYHTWRNPPGLLHVQPDFSTWRSPIEATGTSQNNLVAVFGDGEVLLCNPETGQGTAASVAFRNLSPGIIHALASAPDGSLWASVYLGGEVTHIRGSTFDRLPFPLQADSFAFTGGVMYIGAYPGAYLYAVQLSQPWGSDGNPREVLHVQLAGAPQQDRAFALAASPTAVYLGTIPETGALDGNLGYYNPTNGQTEVFDSPVPDQGITSLTFAANGLLIGTTTALGGGDVPPRDPSGHIFVWNPATQTLVRTIVPAPGLPVWGGLVSTPLGVFGANARAVFRLDPATLAVQVRVINPAGPTGRWGSLTHLFYWRGKLFLLTEGQLYQIDPRTLRAQKLFFGAEQGAVDGDTLYLSYHESVELVAVPLPRLTPANCVYPLHYIEYMDQHPNLIP
jgi:hypothetical protein